MWIKALELHFGWSRAQLTGAFSMAQLEGSIIGPLMGYLIDRLGPRRMVLIGFIITGLGFLVFSRTNSIYIFYLSYGMIMLGTAAGTWLPFMSVVNRWFVRKRGMSMALAGLGSPLGGLVLVPILAWAVTPGSHGWSITAQWIGVAFLCMAWPMSHLIRVSPEEYGLRPRRRPAGLGDKGIVQVRKGSAIAGQAAIHRTAGDKNPFVLADHIWARFLQHSLCDPDGAPGTDAYRPGSVAAAGSKHVLRGHGGGRYLSADRRLCRGQAAKERSNSLFRFHPGGRLSFGGNGRQCSFGHSIRHNFRCRFRWKKSADHRDTGRLLRRKSLCPPSREFPAPRCTLSCWPPPSSRRSCSTRPEVTPSRFSLSGALG